MNFWKVLKKNRIEIGIFSLGMAYFLFLIHCFKNLTHDGIRFQDWDSDTMMQTLPIQALHDTPWHSLWYLHIDAPLFDVIRAFIANIFFGSLNGKALLNATDWTIYHLNAVFFGAFGLLLFTWTRRLINEKCAFVFFLFWVLHPAPLVFATLLDFTFIGSFLITWFFYEFYRVDKEDGSTKKLAVITIVTFYARSFFQWYIIPIVTIALIIRGIERKKILQYFAISMALTLPYILKQYILFGTTSTSSFAGGHKTGVISYQPSKEEIELARSQINYKHPSQADRYNGNDPFNTKEGAENNLIFSAIASKKYSEDWSWTFKQFWKSFKMNRGKYWLPSSQYVSNHKLKDQLPWSRIYDSIWGKTFFSQLTQECIILLFLMMLFWRKNKYFLRTSLSYFLPVGIIFASTLFGNIMGWSEVDRLKFFLEPSIYVFILWTLSTALRSRFVSKFKIKAKI